MYSFDITVWISFSAESTGHQVSSRLLNLKSANALLELPPTGNPIPAGTSVSAIVISDISSIAGSANSLSFDSTVSLKNNISKKISSEVQDIGSKVAILTVSDTVASGAGPDRRYYISQSFFLLVGDSFVSVFYIGSFARRIRNPLLAAPWQIVLFLGIICFELSIQKSY